MSLERDMINKVKSITIVGGGTSGWLTAAYFSKNFPHLKITVVDKEFGSPIGVGEATLLNFKSFMEECGFDINQWFTACDATYKSGILFAKWNDENNDVWHPFFKGNKKIVADIGVHDLWTLNQDLDFKDYALSYYSSSINHNSVDYTNIEGYAFHVDCGKLVKFVQESIIEKISLIKSEVIDVVKSNDNIDYLLLKNQEKIYSDLYIDCTGFLSILKKSNQRVDLEGRLFVNTAVACPVEYQDKPSELKPYAVCEAVDHGWIWKIATQSRIGSGMVFNRNITDIDEAKKYFVEHWDHRINIDKIRVIDWTPFYNLDQWRGNVVSIGLSAGFIEPLESTGIALITAGITQLSNAIQDGMYTYDNIDYYNLQMKLYFEDSVDFVNMHYAYSNRTSKFWNWVKEIFVPSDRMNFYISSLLDETIPVPFNGKFNYIFGGANWSTVLVQLGAVISSRKLPLTDDSARIILLDNFKKNEKYRHVWSRPHWLEIERLKEYYK